MKKRGMQYGIDIIPSEWKDILSKVQQTYPSAVIAGGAIRDLLHNKPVKDIDIFVYETDISKFHANGFISTFKYWDNNEVMGVSSCYYEDSGIIADIIAVNNLDFIGRIDYGICQIQFDGTGFKYTDAYMEDVENKKFTLIRCGSEKEYMRSMARFQRLSHKYPDYMLDSTKFSDYKRV